MGCCASNKAAAATPLPARSPTPRPQPEPVRSPTPAPEKPPPPRPRSVKQSSEPAENVYIEIETGKDQKRIDDVETGYAAAAPPSSNAFQHNNYYWFEDESFRKSDDDLYDFEEYIKQIETPRGKEDGIDIFLSVKNGALGFNGPRLDRQSTKNKPQLSFTDIDNHAMQGTDPSLLDSFKNLISYLTGAIAPADKNRELLTARAIIVWMSEQNLEEVDGEPDLSTPRGLLRHLYEETMTYATCYAILCRAAKLMCALIHGLAKGAEYQPGDTDAPYCPWTAVHVEGSWQVVHPYWMCKALYGDSLDGWIKMDTNAENSDETATGIVTSAFHECYFMPRPDEFIYMCFAKDPKWNLLPASSMIRSKNDFLEAPYLLPPFFDLGLELISEKKCTIVAKDGMCKIAFKAKHSIAHKLVLKYELYVRETTDDENNNIDTDTVSRMVFHTVSNEFYNFDIRFPTEGIFKLVIYGGPHNSTTLRACEFKLVCDKRMEDCTLFPIGYGDIGWGPNLVTATEGLVVPSKPNGLIAVPSDIKKKKIHISYQIEDAFVPKTKYTAKLFREIDGTIEELEQNIKTRVIKRDKILTVVVTLPKRGEYVVSVLSSPRESKSKSKNNETKSNDDIIKTDTEPNKDIKPDTDTEPDKDVRAQTEAKYIHMQLYNGNDTKLRTDHETTNFYEKMDSYKEQSNNEKVVCNYLLSTIVPKRNKPPLRISKQKLNKAFESDKPLAKKIEEVSECIVDCKTEAGKTWQADDDIRAAQTRLEFLVYKNSLKEAHMRRNPKVTIRTLKLVKQYRHHAALVSETERAENLEKELEDLQGHSRAVPKLEKAYQEIVTLVRVPDEVHTTFKALCLLLGEEDIRLEHWFNIQKVLRESNHSQKDRVFRRMRQIEDHEISAQQRDKVETLLNTYSEERVRKSNTSAHSFYVWIQNVLEAYEDEEDYPEGQHPYEADY